MKQAIVLIIATLGIIITSALPAQARDIPFTQEDRDRIIRLEEGQKAANQRFDDIGKRIDDLKESMNNDVRLLMELSLGTLGGMFILIGFVLWDRRTTLAPVVRTTRELEERTTKIEHAIKEKAEKDPELKEALRHAGLL